MLLYIASLLRTLRQVRRGTEEDTRARNKRLPVCANRNTLGQQAGSIVVCEGGTAELVCPRGTVISIALANYGRYSARVCYENEDLDDVVPMTQCHNPKTMPTLRKRSVLAF
ncbi:unnamed protein product [Strongylus vulgaris]|uniref:SUEL-type lectin domain-containing protein n=1 Tax=Strongylus vulgaris TaxID=40348 RepID=A0A3P7JCN9_STRVU|nr:unnamed protein product [Strongylus vulgaris]